MIIWVAKLAHHGFDPPHAHIMHSVDFGTGDTFKAKCAKVLDLPPKSHQKRIEVDYPLTAEAIREATGWPNICSRCVESYNIQEEIRRARR